MCLCNKHQTQEEHFLEEFQDISRLIILNKILYYTPEQLPTKVHERFQVCDNQYDQFEKRYLQLCQILNKPNELVHKSYPDTPDHLNATGMLEVDFSRPDVSTVLKEFI